MHLVVRTLTGHTGPVNSAAISPDGQWIVSALRDKTVRVWRLSDGELVRTLTGHTHMVNSAAIGGLSCVPGAGVCLIPSHAKIVRRRR